MLCFLDILFQLSQKAEETSEKGNGDGDQSTDNTLNEKPSDNTATEEKQSELAPNHSLHYASTEPANAAPKPKPVLQSQKEPTGLEASAPLLNKHYSGYAGEAEVGSHTHATPTTKPTLSSSKKVIM